MMCISIFAADVRALFAVRKQKAGRGVLYGRKSSKSSKKLCVCMYRVEVKRVMAVCRNLCWLDGLRVCLLTRFAARALATDSGWVRARDYIGGDCRSASFGND